MFDTGAYIEWSIEGIAAVLVGGPYRWDAFDVRAYGVRTNRFGTGSYRGPGGPQAAFAIESLLDELAAKLGLDPIELRARNLAAEGDPMVDGEPWPGLGHAAVLEAAAAHPMWRDRASLPAGEGVGVALGVWPGGKAPAAALCRLNPDGSITITTGVVDMSGTTGAFQIIAAETFGLDPSKVEVVALDTDGAPQSPLSGGSVITYSSGRAIREAAADARRQLLAYAAHRDGDRPGRPRDRRRRRPPARLARIAAGRSPSSPRSCPTSAASSRRSRATPARSRPASRRRRRRTSRTSGSTRRPAT